MTANFSDARLTLARADVIASHAIEYARSASLRPVAVAVLDAAGSTLVVKREEDASLIRHEMAAAKAWGALALGYGSRELVRRNQVTPTFYTSLSIAASGKILPVLGGVLVRNAAGQVVGAVGLTGDSQENDDACAVAAVRHAGFIADNGDPY